MGLQSQPLKPIPVARAVRALSISTPGSIPVHHPPAHHPGVPVPWSSPVQTLQILCKHRLQIFSSFIPRRQKSSPFPQEK